MVPNNLITSTHIVFVNICKAPENELALLSGWSEPKQRPRSTRPANLIGHPYKLSLTELQV